MHNAVNCKLPGIIDSKTQYNNTISDTNNRLRICNASHCCPRGMQFRTACISQYCVCQSVIGCIQKLERLPNVLRAYRENNEFSAQSAQPLRISSANVSCIRRISYAFNPKFMHSLQFIHSLQFMHSLHFSFIEYSVHFLRDSCDYYIFHSSNISRVLRIFRASSDCPGIQ